MNSWSPITEEDFIELFNQQYNEMSVSQREVFDKYKVNFGKAIIKRSDMYGDEYVFVVAEIEDEVLYFDDVEYGFNLSSVDKERRIQHPTGNQWSLQEAVLYRFPKPS